MTQKTAAEAPQFQQKDDANGRRDIAILKNDFKKAAGTLQFGKTTTQTAAEAS